MKLKSVENADGKFLVNDHKVLVEIHTGAETTKTIVCILIILKHLMAFGLPYINELDL